MEEPELEPELSLATSVLPQLVGGLQAPGAADRAEALGQLAQIVDTSFGEDALVLGEYLRMSGGIDALVALLEDEEPMLHQTALLLIGNLASDAVDPNSVLTKGVLKEVGCFELLQGELDARQVSEGRRGERRRRGGGSSGRQRGASVKGW